MKAGSVPRRLLLGLGGTTLYPVTGPLSVNWRPFDFAISAAPEVLARSGREEQGRPVSLSIGEPSLTSPLSSMARFLPNSGVCATIANPETSSQPRPQRSSRGRVNGSDGYRRLNVACGTRQTFPFFLRTCPHLRTDMSPLRPGWPAAGRRGMFFRRTRDFYFSCSRQKETECSGGSDAFARVSSELPQGAEKPAGGAGGTLPPGSPGLPALLGCLLFWTAGAALHLNVEAGGTSAKLPL